MKRTESYHEYLINRLKDPIEALGYLNAVLEEKDQELFLNALRNVVEAQGGMAKLSKKAHLNRESLYRMLSKKGNPYLMSISALADAFGWRLALVEKNSNKIKKAA